MIKINVYKNKEIIEKVTIKGHSMYADHGKDIVCAAVSTLAITSLNIILKIDKDSVKYTEASGDINIEIIKDNKTINLIIDNMIEMFLELEKEYKNNIKIII